MIERFDLIIVGMGSGGMTAADFAGTLDLNVAIIERGRIGGDCLWTGCVPSKALLASAKVAHTIRTADRFGLTATEPEIDLAQVWRRIRTIRDDIAHTDDDPARFEAIGVRVMRGFARVTGSNEVTIDDHTIIEGRFILLCTGSSPLEPDLPGLRHSGFLTNETLFELENPPSSMTMIGGGPVGIEMAQALTRLGVATTVLQQGLNVLPNDEPLLTGLLTERLRAEGVGIHLNAQALAVSSSASSSVATKTVTADIDGQVHHVEAEEVMVAVGRRPNVEGLGLEDFDIEIGPRGVLVDNRGRTTVKTIYAVGDIAGRWLFTHSAGYEAVRAVRDMFFPGKGSVDDFIPWCTFTDPELAHAGMTVAEAEAKFGDDVDVWRQDLVHNDRARADSSTVGAVIVVTAKNKLVGAHILAPSAGEMIHELALAIRHDMKLSDIASLIHVYPTYGTAVGQLAAESAFEKAHKLRWLMRRER